ncbi:MAG: histidine kinase [Clostridium sp.]|uniref:sensor histidine kinase n=1 Tax=Clostridia TaxID=186801 RepID=UPI0011DCC766|nr:MULTISPECIES: histidine kinase [Clostridia]MDU7709440.1 histidine kinase [Clostridium sp.]MEE0202581.1 histidine kinase [Muricomes sp.]
MKFQKKIILVYMLFSVIVTGIFGSVYYALNVRQYKEREYTNISTVSNVKLQQMETLISGMEGVITYFLSDVSILDALQGFSDLEADTYEEMYFDTVSSIIRSKLSTYYLMDEYYRVIVFNKNGNVISNTNYTGMAPDIKASYETYPWKEEVSEKGGKDIILGLHEDDWGSRKKPMVISVVKEIQGMDMGYVEVQQSKKALDEMIADQDEAIRYLFVTKKGDLLYAGDESTDAGHYLSQIEDSGEGIQEIRSENGEEVLCLRQESETQDIILLTIADTDIAKNAAAAVLPVSILLLVGLWMISLGYVYLTSRQLTKPIRQLQHFMETTHLGNLEAEIPEKISNDEIESLYVAYREVMERLNESILKEKRLSLLQLQAQFDLLQAQVNPHFLYNVLNVISGRGIMADDEVICDICGELAGMLRYATNTKAKYATVAEELESTKSYLKLLKYRYDYRLSYEIHEDDDIREKRLPKIVLQQIVENAAVHGYEKSEDIMEVSISGYHIRDSWYIRIHDNGCGISKGVLEKVEESMESVRKKLTNDRTNVELEIGGMGLVNTYARLYLLYTDKLIFRIESNEAGGTDVIIGVEEEEESV